MPERPDEVVTTVLVPILIQDPAVLGARGWKAAATHPSGARCRAGFVDGPACERVAVVDVDVATGALRPPARVLRPDEVGMYRDVGGYAVTPPAAGGKPELWQRTTKDRARLASLERPGYADDPFLKVSAFGTVLRTLGFLESPVALARRTRWAFRGSQLLVVPAAGERENAFYDRESGSLRFFHFRPASDPQRTIFTALSQDVVVHETAHAVIDAAAPDLYHASSPDSLALHEGLADITAALISLLNREFQPDRSERRTERFIEALGHSSRFSRFAEQFGSLARGSATLRELVNDRRLGADHSDPDVVDVASPHQLSEVLSGALFAVLRRCVLAVDRYGPREPFRGHDQGGRSGLAVATAGRIASLACKGLDWLPPGDVSLADYGRAALAADRFHLPELAEQRALLAAELERRGVAPAGTLEAVPDVDPIGAVDFAALQSGRAKARAFVRRHRALFGIPRGVPFERPRVRLQRALPGRMRGWCRGDTVADLDQPVPPASAREAELAVIQVGWWMSEPHAAGRGFGSTREVKTGATLAVDRRGRVHALLRGGGGAEHRARRDAFLARLERQGRLLAPHRRLGPDGAPLVGYLHAEPGAGGTRFNGGLRALHLLEDPP